MPATHASAKSFVHHALGAEESGAAEPFASTRVDARLAARAEDLQDQVLGRVNED